MKIIHYLSLAFIISIHWGYSQEPDTASTLILDSLARGDSATIPMDSSVDDSASAPEARIPPPAQPDTTLAVPDSQPITDSTISVQKLNPEEIDAPDTSGTIEADSTQTTNADTLMETNPVSDDLEEADNAEEQEENDELEPIDIPEPTVEGQPEDAADEIQGGRAEIPTRFYAGVHGGAIPQKGQWFPASLTFETPSFFLKPLSLGVQGHYHYYSNPSPSVGIRKEIYHNIYTTGYLLFYFDTFYSDFSQYRGKLRTYVKGAAGWGFSYRYWYSSLTDTRYKVESDEEGFIWSGSLGAKYFLTDFLAATGELGYGIALLQIGLEFAF